MKCKATYSKTFTAEKEDAVRIAKLKQPKDTKLENVIESEDDLFELLAGIMKPNNK